ncbi:MAG: acetate/propionate family kinase, partial [Methylomarinum sp.]|nr:acetate/propionate family kinase [Methylomarinum sp.]
MKILVINSGSSSIKYSLFEMDNLTVLASGVIERIGESSSPHLYQWLDRDGMLQKVGSKSIIENHQQGIAEIIKQLLDSSVLKKMSDLSGIGHRVVHGGELFHQPVLIDDSVLEGIRKMIPLAPLHNPANLTGIEIFLQHVQNIPQVAVFDTAFHQTMPAYAFHYALPKALYEQEQVRRYGFHGTSHYYVAKQAANFLNKPLQQLNLIVLHLGNGASATAIEQGQSVDTSMGMTPLEGLVMGTRSGDIDPAIPFYLNAKKGMTHEEIDALLNKQSGLKGICGENDMRAVHQMANKGDEDAQLALDIYCYRIKKYIGAYFAVLGKVDAVIFTGGIGENDAYVREKSCEGLGLFGLEIDNKKNL